MRRTDADRVRDILDAIAGISRAEKLMTDQGDDDITIVAIDAITYRLFTIGEAVKALPDELTAQHPAVPWSNIARMRDVIGHHYYRRDPQVVRATIQEPLAHLRTACVGLVDELP